MDRSRTLTKARHRTGFSRMAAYHDRHSPPSRPCHQLAQLKGESDRHMELKVPIYAAQR